MKKLLLEKIRLSWYFIFFLIFFAMLCLLVPRYKFESGALTLFSVNSFLYGFYIAPILSAQKARIEEMHKNVRAEANAIFAMVIKLKPLPKELRNSLQDMFITYLNSCLKERKATEGEDNYEALIGYCLNYHGEHKEEIGKLLDGLVANEQNRTNFNMQIRNKVYSNEWTIMAFLFGITLIFVMFLDTGSNMVFRILAALLSTGLSMLLIILVKLSTLTHKKAKQVWDPYKKLIDSRFYRID
jgi:hypothetical protein